MTKYEVGSLPADDLRGYRSLDGLCNRLNELRRRLITLV